MSTKAYNGMLFENVDSTGQAKLAVIDIAGNGDTCTQFAVFKDTKELDSLLTKDLYDTNSSKFHALKNLAQFFPVRRELPEFVAHCRGFLPEFRTLVDYIDKHNLTTGKPNKCLLADGDKIIQKYTTEGNWYCTRLNIMLALDKLDSENALYAKKLKACVGWQTPKWRGLTYRGALHNPLEIFVMAFKYIFFFPGFISTSMDPSKIIFKEYPESGGNPLGTYQNVIFEIDTSSFPNFSTIIKSHQTAYDESESLLSCYNIYKWKGLRVVNNIMIISLEVLNPELVRDMDKKEITGLHNNLPTEWLGKKGEIMRTRDVAPVVLTNNVKTLFESYGRLKNINFKNLLNANFDSVSVVAQQNKSCVSNFPKTGASITGVDLTILEAEQRANLETGKAKIKIDVEKQLGIQQPKQPEIQQPKQSLVITTDFGTIIVEKNQAPVDLAKPKEEPEIPKKEESPANFDKSKLEIQKEEQLLDEKLLEVEKKRQLLAEKILKLEEKSKLLSEKLLEVKKKKDELSTDAIGPDQSLNNSDSHAKITPGEIKPGFQCGTFC